MKEQIINGKTYLFVEIPEKGKFRYKKMPDNSKELVATIYDDEGNKGFCYISENPQGIIIGRASELTEEQWKGIVRELPVGNRYENYNGDYPIWCHSAKESGLSILKSNGFQKETTLIIQKQ